MAYVDSNHPHQLNDLDITLCMPAWISPFDAGSVDPIERSAWLCRLCLRAVLEQMASLEADFIRCDEGLQEVASKLAHVMAAADIQVIGKSKELKRAMDAMVIVIGDDRHEREVSAAQFDSVGNSIPVIREIVAEFNADLASYRQESWQHLQRYKQLAQQYNDTLFRYKQAAVRLASTETQLERLGDAQRINRQLGQSQPGRKQPILKDLDELADKANTRAAGLAARVQHLRSLNDTIVQLSDKRVKNDEYLATYIEDHNARLTRIDGKKLITRNENGERSRVITKEGIGGRWAPWLRL